MPLMFLLWKHPCFILGCLSSRNWVLLCSPSAAMKVLMKVLAEINDYKDGSDDVFVLG